MASKQDAIDAMVDLLHNGKNGTDRAGAAAGLGVVGGEAARTELIAALKKAKSSEERGAIATALGHATLR